MDQVLSWREYEGGPIHALHVSNVHQHGGESYFSRATTACGIDVPDVFQETDEPFDCAACRDVVHGEALSAIENIVADAFAPARTPVPALGVKIV